MTNKTIPALPSAATLDGTEPVETVQSSASVKTTTADIAALGAWTLTDGSHTVANVGQVTVTGGTVGGTTPNATLTISGGGSSYITPNSGSPIFGPTANGAYNATLQGSANTGGAGGFAYVRGGTGSTNGGDAYLMGGTGGSGRGGSVNLYGGTSSSSSYAGNAGLYGGKNTSTGHGGNCYMQGGPSTGGAGGNCVINPGKGTGAAYGNIVLKNVPASGSGLTTGMLYTAAGVLKVHA